MTTTSTDPSWLAARRERAAAASAELALPDATVPGWEFTDLGGLDLDAFPPAPAETAGGDAVFDDVAVPDGVTAMPLAQAVAERPELVERHLGSVVSSEGDPFAARNDAEWTSGLLVHVGPGVVADGPVVARAVQAAGLTSPLGERCGLYAAVGYIPFEASDIHLTPIASCYNHLPRLAADLAVLDVLLHLSTRFIDKDRVLLSAIRT